MGMTKEEILKELDPLFEKAEKENLYFYSNYQCIWMSPKKLRQYHKEGSFIWGPVNWQLKDPKVRTEELKERIVSAKKQLKEWELQLL
jgi:hypothetical protein